MAAPKTQTTKKPTEVRKDFISTLRIVNPYTKQVFEPSMVVKDVKLDSWTESQLKAGLLKEVE